MTARRPGLSVIIPAYNEEKRLPRALRRLSEYFGARGIGADDLEILVVDDGSSDGTASVVEEWIGKLPALRLVSNGRNRGKGFSVRHGMLEAQGRLALFTDADLSSPIEELEKLQAGIRGGSDLAIGSRALDRSLIAVHQTRLREMAGIIFNGFVRFSTGLSYKDTQCGFKLFVLDRARIVFEQQQIEGFGFDPEILFLAKRHGLRGAEIPVRWAHDPATKVHVVRDSLRMFGDLIYIRWNWLRGAYPKKT
jgi:dolichyl-phosphate beta-glucosyltransferase